MRKPHAFLTRSAAASIAATVFLYAVALTATPSASDTKAFNPRSFRLSELVENLDAGNHFQLPEKAQTFILFALKSGPDFTFTTTDNKNIIACINSKLSNEIKINPAYPPRRIGEGICHELLHHEDFRDFKPIVALKRKGLTREQGASFYPQVGALVNMVSHEYVKKQLEAFGYAEAMAPAMTNRLSGLDARLSALETTLSAVADQLVPRKGKKSSVGMKDLQILYRDLMFMTIRDKLLFTGSYTKEIDVLLARFQHILDFIRTSTPSDPRFVKVYRDTSVPTAKIRDMCRKYHGSEKNNDDRYALITGTFNAVFDKVGLRFKLIPRPPGAPVLRVSSELLKEGESFLLDGSYRFSDVEAFTPYKERN